MRPSSLRQIWARLNLTTLNQIAQENLLKQFPEMRFVQFLRKNDNRKRLGAVSADGTEITELSDKSCISHDMLHFLSQNFSADELENKIKFLQSERITDNYELLPPISNPGKIICVGLNYKDHCEEQQRELPKEPMFFSKFNTSITGPCGDIIAHRLTKKIDWEVELAVVIGKAGKNITRENAFDHVFGYTVAQDITARDWQKERNGGQFLIGKSMDTFLPIGPYITHKSLVSDVNNLCMMTIVNGVVKQNGNTAHMIFKIDELISRLSQSMTLLPGDILITGTPAGVGAYRNPREFLKPGDVIETQIQCLGRLVNKVVAPPEECAEEPAVVEP